MVRGVRLFVTAVLVVALLASATGSAAAHDDATVWGESHCHYYLGPGTVATAAMSAYTGGFTMFFWPQKPEVECHGANGLGPGSPTI